MQHNRKLNNQLDLFEQPIQEDKTKYYVTWEEKKLNAKDLHWMAKTKIKTTCRPMPHDELIEFIEFLKSCYSYCGWHHITKAPKSCNHACSPSDYYKGGKCDKMGCYDN